jgi:hypothetical protein
MPSVLLFLGLLVAIMVGSGRYIQDHAARSLCQSPVHSKHEHIGVINQHDALFFLLRYHASICFRPICNLYHHPRYLICPD